MYGKAVAAASVTSNLSLYNIGNIKEGCITTSSPVPNLAHVQFDSGNRNDALMVTMGGFCVILVEAAHGHWQYTMHVQGCPTLELHELVPCLQRLQRIRVYIQKWTLFCTALG